MLAVTSRLWFAALGLVTGACALAGYDFGDYERAPVTTSAGGADTAGSGISLTATPFASGGDDASSTAGHGAGGDETSGGAGAPGASGASGAFGEAPTPVCVPRGCFELGLACGPADDGCGRPLDCGPCFWWFQECVENRCEIPE
ncbi:MAG TPA: hypothetical protein VHP33_09830 [Polyangiaceae bacterium]|nr:hypothetical protein [Polyangiaceae bacterium]